MRETSRHLEEMNLVISITDFWLHRNDKLISVVFDPLGIFGFPCSISYIYLK